MTCIVGLEDLKQNKIVIGGDSAAFSLDTIDLIDRPKVFRVHKNIIVGYCGSFRLGQVLEFELKFKKISLSEDWLYTTFIKTMKQTLQVNEIFLTEDNPALASSDIIVGFAKKIYSIQSDFSLLRSPRGYCTAGSGDKVAQGSLYSTEGLLENSNQRVLMALESAQCWCPGVRGPFHILEG